jgi:hypothetical protein
LEALARSVSIVPLYQLEGDALGTLDCEHSGNYASVPLFLLIVATSEASHDPQA